MERRESLSNKDKSGPADTQFGSNRRVRWIVFAAVVLTALAVLGVIGLALLAADHAHTNLTILAALLAAPIVCGLAAIQSVRINKYDPACWWIIAGIALMTFAVTAGNELVSEVFPGIGILAYFAIILFVNVAMDQRHIQSAILWTAAGFLAARAIGYFASAQPISVPILGTAANWAFAILTVVILLLLRYNLRSLNLVSKVISALIALIIIASLVMTISINATTTQALQKSAGENLNGLARSQSTAASDLILSQINSLTSFSLSEAVQRELKTTNSSYPLDPDRAKELLTRKDTEWRNSVASGMSTSLLLDSRMSNAVSQDLKEFIRVFPQYTEVVVTDKMGGLAGASGQTRGYDYSQEDWWRQARNEKAETVFISVPYYDLFTRAYVIRFALPVYARNTSNLIGIVGATYRVQGLFELVTNSGFGKTGEADLLFTGSPPRLIHGDGLAEVTPEFVNSMKSITGTAVDMNYHGADSLVSQMPMITSTGEKVIKNLEWLIVAHQDTAEAYAPVASQTAEIYRIVSMLATLIAGLATFLVQFVTGPVTRLQHVAETLREGDLSARATVESNDEIGLLATTLNTMTDQLQQTLTGLEQRVGERTRELSLSGEVGRSLSQERDLGRLLQNAVNQIQQSFDLYYVQIYLTDAKEENLVMQAGSGEVGKELQSKAHRLGIGTGSINGSAAAGKRSVLVRDTTQSELFRPNPLLPVTRSELAVPLQVGPRVVGVLDMQSSQAGRLTPESLPAFEALASQLAIAVENAELFAQVEVSRKAVEAQVRVQTRSGWESFMDAIRRGERLGYRYDSSRRQAVPVTDAEAGDEERETKSGRLERPIVISGVTVGKIALHRENEGWTSAELELINSVASQVAHQIDSLRLLSQSDEYRAEAEQAARRLTRQGWEEFLAASPSNGLQFVYDQNKVRSVTPEMETEAAMDRVVQPLLVQGVPVGEIAIEGVDQLDPEALDLLQTVSARLSDHIESLRLVEQTQEALILAEQSEAALRQREQNLQNQNEAIGELTRSEAIAQGDFESALKQITETAARTLRVERSSVWLLTPDEQAIHCIDLFQKSQDKHSAGIVFQEKDVPDYFRALKQERMIVTENAYSDSLSSGLSDIYLKRYGVGALLNVPIRSGGRLIGVFCNDHVGASRRWLAEEENFASAIADIVMLAFTANERRNRALQEQRIREVSTQVFGASDLNTVMRRAVEQIGRVLGTPAYIYVGQTNGHNTPDTGEAHHTVESLSEE